MYKQLGLIAFLLFLNTHLSVCVSYSDSGMTDASISALKDLFKEAIRTPAKSDSLVPLSRSSGNTSDYTLTDEDLETLARRNVRVSKDSIDMQKIALASYKVVEKLKNLYEENSQNLRYKAPTNHYSSKYTFQQIIGELKIPDFYCPLATEICCDPYYPYRQIDSSCNNLENPWWTRSGTPKKRYLEAHYDDGKGTPRTKSVLPHVKLPNPFRIAEGIFSEKKTNTSWSQFLTYFGQFVDHDLVQTATSADYNGKPKTCSCGTYDPDCFNIDAYDYSYFNKQSDKCFPFTRDAASLKTFNCKFGDRETFNLFSSTLDLSQVYGSNDEESKKLRGEHGLLKDSTISFSDLPHLPLATDEKCKTKCYVVPDPRAEQSGMLTSMHTLFLREHNRIAKILWKQNPLWNADKVFEEARKVNIAQYQAAVYNEYLPSLIGYKTMAEFKLVPERYGYSYSYNSKIFPQIASDFAGAGFRLHYTISNDFAFFDLKTSCKNIRIPSELGLWIDHPTQFLKFSHCFYEGLLYNPAVGASCGLAPFLNENLFHVKGNSLSAINVQRGRDQGLAPYYKYREFCGLGTAHTFEDLKNIPQHIRKKLSEIYQDVRDIDVFVGMASEVPLEDGSVGATAACIIARQFYDLMYGDRFFYTHGHNEYTRFRPDQLEQLRLSTLSKIICHNSHISVIQENPYLLPNEHYNPYVQCSRLPVVSLDHWSASKSTSQILLPHYV